MQIETSRLILRPFVETDAKAASYNSKTSTVAHFMSDMVLETEADAAKWIRWLETKCNDHEPCQVLAIELNAERTVVGLIGVAPKRELGGEIEILFSIADEYQNKGYVTEAAKAIIWWAFEKAGQDVLSAIVKPENIASRYVIEKLGFIYVDTRTLPYDGADCTFDYFRLYHTDSLPGPEWDILSLYKPEPMSAFFDVRAEGYDDHMLCDGGIADYEKLGSFIPKTDEEIKILDIGCGTGIELDYIWVQAPNAHITCVDMSRGMLDLLLKNHPESHDRITDNEASYLNWGYQKEAFDLVVSSMTMHHLWPEEKTEVYRKILSTLKPGGVYIESDFIVNAVLSEQYRRRYELITAGLPETAKAGEYHIDIPLTADVQKELLAKAGFKTVEVLDEQINHGNGAILRATKAPKLTVKNMRLETERLIIRPYIEDDLMECFELMQDEELFRYLDMSVMTLDEYSDLFHWLIGSYEVGFDEDFKYSFNIILKETGRHIGWVGIGGTDFDHSVKEIYWLIGRNYQKNGYASEAAAALLEYGFSAMGLGEIVACCKPENIASEKVMQKIGLKYRGIIEGMPDQHRFYNGEPEYALTRKEYYAANGGKS